MRMLRMFLVGLALVIGAGGCSLKGGIDSASEGRECSPRMPAYLSTAGEGVIAPTSDSRIALAARDGTLTAIAWCLSSLSLPAFPPNLLVHGHLLEPMGGSLEQGGGGAVNYLTYPATRALSIRVVRRGRLLGSVRFPPVPQRECPTQAHRPFEILGCESIFIARWQTHLSFDPRKLQLMDVRLVDDANRRHSLGFYFVRAARDATGVVVKFGFQRPAGDTVDVRLIRVYLTTKNGEIRQHRFRPPIRTVLDLHAV